MNILMLLLIALCCLGVVLFPGTITIFAMACMVAFAVSQLKGPDYEKE